MIWVELLACVVIWLSFWSLIPRDEWWFRGADFPRLQILALGLIAFILMLVWDAPWNWVREVILLGYRHNRAHGFTIPNDDAAEFAPGRHRTRRSKPTGLDRRRIRPGRDPQSTAGNPGDRPHVRNGRSFPENP